MNKKIRIGAVSYLNTKPLLFGFNKNDWNIIEDYPAKIAQMLMNDEIDVGLVPVAIIPKMKEYHIISDYCIGATERVESVAIFSEVEMDKIETVILDYQSRTSVNLAKVLLKHYWKKEIIFEEATPDFRNNIKGTTAAVVIGDRALEQIKLSTYQYDLAEAWIMFTGRPFVFAAWVANKPLDKDFVTAFNEANGYGLSHLEEVIKENQFPHFSLKTYYTKCISYNLTEEKKEGLQLFLSYLTEK